jgi:YidC/Oxa1 family membrane protein insertase
MDKKNFTIGAILLVAAFALMVFGPKSPPPAAPPSAPATSGEAVANPATVPGAPRVAATPSTAGQAAPVGPALTSSTPATLRQVPTNARITTLSNEFVEVRFTEYGGAIREVAFKKYAAVQGRPEPYLLNQFHEAPILAIGDYPGLGPEMRYRLVSSTSREVVYRAVIEGQVEVTRTYRLDDPAQAGSEPYRLRHETVFRNLAGTPITLPRATLSLGTTTLLNDRDTGQYLSVASYDGEDMRYVERSELEGGGFMALFGSPRPPTPVLENPGNVVWAATKNQFFTSLYTPERPAVGWVAKRLELPAFPTGQANVAMTGAMRFDVPVSLAATAGTLAGSLYVGPQEYKRLSKLEHDQDKVLPYTQYFFNRIFLSGYVAPFLNILLNAIHGWIGNWGVAIILMTILLKFVSLPFTLKASKSAKQMSKLQPELQVIREKYKDNPQKQQQATMEVFKKHKVNPVGSCIPILITMPLFIGFFAMLQSPAELRFQPFLWAPDLSAPDTVARIPFLGLPINIMPLLMGATMYYQMRLTPTPSVDNMQLKMMRFMPVIFTLFCYQFSCALSLYSTINGVFTIIQQVIINRMNDEPGPA